MTKEKKTFAWDTILTMSLETDKLTVLDTDIEVKWCPITKMFWEKQKKILVDKSYFIWYYQV